MLYLYRQAHKQGSIKEQAPRWGGCVRVAHRGPSAGCPVPARARLYPTLQGTAPTRARTDPLPNSTRVLGDVGAEGSPQCSAFSRWESVSSPGNPCGGLMQPCRGSGDSFPGCPHSLQTPAQGAGRWLLPLLPSGSQHHGGCTPMAAVGECPCTLLRLSSLRVI